MLIQYLLTVDWELMWLPRVTYVVVVTTQDVCMCCCQVVVDIEWGAFGDNGSLDFIRSAYEKEVDLHSNHVGSFTYVFLL